MENFDALALNWDAQPQRDERARTVAVEITIRIPNLQMMHGFEYGCGTGGF